MAAQLKPDDPAIAAADTPAANDGAPAPSARAPAPLVCRAWADAIVRWWESQLARGAIDPLQPPCVLELAPAGPAMAWAMLAALDARLAASPCAGMRPHYVFGADSAALLAHPYLAALARQGRISAGPVPAGAPLVCLAWRVFETMPSILHGVARGVAYVADDALGWSACAPDDSLRGALLDYYGGRCGVALTLPLAACTLLDEMARACSGNYLLLAADHGACTLKQVRLLACAAPDAQPNLHALMLAQQWRGATTWCGQQADDGLVLQMAWREAGGAPPAADAEAVAQLLARAHPDDAARLCELAAGLAPASALALAPALLRSAGDDPAVLQACIEAVLAGAADGVADLALWRDTLERVWARYLPPSAFDPFYHQAGVLASQLGHWGMAKACFGAGLAVYGDEPLDLHHLAWCELESGDAAAARQLLQRALALDPAHAACRALLAQLDERLAAASATAGYDASRARDGELALEPLHPAHANALLTQYRDPHIAELTCLPPMHDDADAADWIAAQRSTPDRSCYAVMHADWGLVGLVCMHRGGDAGYFHFFIGTDFQECGYGPRAACLLWELEARVGVRTVFTSVYAENWRSRRALGLLGFDTLPAIALAPNDDMVFMCKPFGAPLAAPAALQRLRALCAAIDSPLQFLPPEEEA